MEKKDLKVGMSVRHRNGQSSIILGKEDFKVMYSTERHITLDHINDDLTHKTDDDLDIVEISEHPNECFYNLYEAINFMQLDGHWKSVWKRDNN